MPTTDQIAPTIEKVKKMLSEYEYGHLLEVGPHSTEDEWLYIMVGPREGITNVRASDHAKVMSRIEEQLQEENIHDVLLVPVLD